MTATFCCGEKNAVTTIKLGGVTHIDRGHVRHFVEKDVKQHVRIGRVETQMKRASLVDGPSDSLLVVGAGHLDHGARFDLERQLPTDPSRKRAVGNDVEHDRAKIP